MLEGFLHVFSQFTRKEMVDQQEATEMITPHVTDKRQQEIQTGFSSIPPHPQKKIKRLVLNSDLPV